ncbi:MAG TPA: putative glycoside hydrolase, partial [Gemmatimonadaceae bacterium]|nr:putative glycoside hydrolase [Gemmatimonadaceae bacterium]
MRFHFLSLALLLPACSGHDASATTKGALDSVAASSVGGRSDSSTHPVAAAVAPSAAAGPVSAQVQKLRTDLSTPIRGLYINRFAAQSSKKMGRLIAVADSTEINAFVIDIKDEFGLNFHSSDPMLQKNEGTAPKVANLKGLVDTLNAHGILPIARIVVFKDSVTARM